ncbi:dimethyladenosine transferase 1, mitochondrial [Galendromus occidentalis]|uniref:rRNA adenine N(6)-methyltransferase n=1 Tax=Galendromus occidentalis TaxID=34638 RepID=A0AAJ6W058_9ACAR|nr:dimethyladenosine transferase 1, mitochondrial [Galendromus occidentalis]
MAAVMAIANVSKKVRLPPLPTPAELLRLYRLKALKQMSQNFLLDPRICRKLIRSAGNLHKAHVIEVGPGPGNLTRPILELGATCSVIEKDLRFMPCLDLLAEAAEGRLKVIHGDVLTYPIHSEIPPELARPWESEKPPRIHLIGNLPFAISTVLLVKWLKEISERSGPWQFGRVRMTLTFQKEVSTRITLGDIDMEKCRLSIISQGYCEVEECFTIVGGSFVPPPLVDVGVVKLVPRVKPVFNQDFSLVEKVLRCMFNAKRKTVEQNLPKLFPQPLLDDIKHDVLEKAELDPKEQTLMLTTQEFSRLCDVYAEYCEKVAGLYEYNYRGPRKTRDWSPAEDVRDIV